MNVLAALAAPDTHTEADALPPPLTGWAVDRTGKGEDIVAFRQHARPPDRGVPRMVVMDNASHHRGRKVREARSDLRQQNLPLYYWPPYSPELNASERLFRQAQHEGMPRRTQPHVRALTAAVHACFRDLQDELVLSYLSMRSA